MILKTEIIKDIRQGFETAYINGTLASNLEYKPSFVSNNPKEGKKVISTIEEELLRCEHFQISVAFITMGGQAVRYSVMNGVSLSNQVIHWNPKKFAVKQNFNKVIKENEKVFNDYY